MVAASRWPCWSMHLIKRISSAWWSLWCHTPAAFLWSSFGHFPLHLWSELSPTKCQPWPIAVGVLVRYLAEKSVVWPSCSSFSIWWSASEWMWPNGCCITTTGGKLCTQVGCDHCTLSLPVPQPRWWTMDVPSNRSLESLNSLLFVLLLMLPPPSQGYVSRLWRSCGGSCEVSSELLIGCSRLFYHLVINLPHLLHTICQMATIAFFCHSWFMIVLRSLSSFYLFPQNHGTKRIFPVDLNAIIPSF